MKTILMKEILAMKKIFVVVFALLLSIALISTAFAAIKIGDATGNDAISTTFGGGEYRPSSKVTVSVSTDAAGLGYCASSQHAGASTNQTAGRQFATLSNSPQILFAPSETLALPALCTSTTTPPTLPSGPVWAAQ
jgi:hypothetical protein